MREPPSETAPLILIVNDDGDQRARCTRSNLNMVGYRVETAEDGNEAIFSTRLWD
jgi:PleD family two-component response regulator